MNRYGSAQVYFDLTGNSPGTDWTTLLDSAQSEAAAVLVLIGKSWTNELRKERDFDWVRYEVANALRIDASRRVIPILLDGATMPQLRDLPSDLSRLASVQAADLSLSPWEWGPGCRHLYELMSRLLVRESKLPAEKERRWATKLRERTHTVTASPEKTGEGLCFLFDAWRYPILTVDDVDAEIRFLPGSGTGLSGKALQLIYKTASPTGVLVRIDRFAGGAIATVFLPSLQRVTAGIAIAAAHSGAGAIVAGPAGFALARAWENRLLAGLWNELDRNLKGFAPGPDPAKMFGVRQ